MLEARIKSNFAFNAPETVEIGEEVPVDLYLGVRMSRTELMALVTGPGRVHSDTAMVGSIVHAALTGGAFKILPTNDGDQPIASMEPTHWNWRVTPLKGGLQTLHLTLSTVFHVGGTDRRREVRNYDRPIHVHVGMGKLLSGFVQEHGKWAWSALLVPIGAYLVRLRARQKDSGRPPAKA